MYLLVLVLVLYILLVHTTKSMPIPDLFPTPPFSSFARSVHSGDLPSLPFLIYPHPMCRSIYIDIIVAIFYQTRFFPFFFSFRDLLPVSFHFGFFFSRSSETEEKKKNSQPGQLPLFYRSIAKTWCCLTIFTHNNNKHKFIKSFCI